jgi:murein L,D-transpeptidase YafK
MRFWDGLNRYLAYRLKEIEFRFHTWKRSREISRAYDARSAGKVGGGGVAVAAPYALTAVKFAGVAAAVCLLVFGVVKALPLLSLAIAAKPGGDDLFAADEDRRLSMPEPPEDAVLPEAAVLPEGYAELSVSAVPQDSVRIEAPPPPPPLPPSPSRNLVEVFKAGIPRGVSEEWLILVDKASKALYIFKGGAGGWEVARSFPIATGEADGRKMVEGDKKTPEGVYFIVGRKHRSELTNVYGPAAFILDYPNDDDRRERRTGYGIWLHGSERGGIPPLFTQGCVAVANQDILEIAGLLRNWAGVPVVIVSGTEDGRKHFAAVDFQKMKSRGEEVVRYHNEKQAEFEALVTGWKSAWESRDIDAYSSFYLTSSFADGATRWDAYRERKERLFRAYSSIYVDLSNIVLTEYTDNIATVKFYQVYNTNVNNRMENAKRLIFRKDQGNWKIYREIPFSKEELLL